MSHPARHSRITALAILCASGLALGIAAHAACDSIDPLGVLPEDGGCPGWNRDGAPMTAYTLEELMTIIDGMAMLYDQYGFVAAAFQNYLGEISGLPTGATLAAFNLGSATNAQALYLDPESGWGDAVTDWEGSGAARMRHDFGYVTFQFWEECFFVTIVVGAGDQGLDAAARCLADAALGRIQGATPSAIDDWGAIKAQFR